MKTRRRAKEEKLTRQTQTLTNTWDQSPSEDVPRAGPLADQPQGGTGANRQNSQTDKKSARQTGQSSGKTDSRRWVKTAKSAKREERSEKAKRQSQKVTDKTEQEPTDSQRGPQL